MKILSVLVLCMAVFFVKSEEFTKENFIAIANACKAEAGATDDELQLFYNHAPAATKSGKCLKACSLKKFDILTADSKLNVESTTAIKNVMAKGNAEQEKLGAEVIDICAKLKLPADNCEAAEALNQCFKKNSDAKGFIFTNFA